VRQRLLWATCVAAIAAGTGSALAAPLGQMNAARPTLAAEAITPVQYWGDWGPRYERPYVEPYYGRRYITPDDDDDDVGMIAPQRAITIARSMGYRAISRPRLAGRAWVVDALGPQGQRTRVSINAYTGAPLAIRELEPGGQRFPTPPVWRDERPGFGRDTGRGSPEFREGRLDNDPQRLDPRPEQRPERPARPGPNITARIVPVPTPRPDIDGGLTPQPQVVPPVASPPPAEQPAPQPPAARLNPREVTPVAPTPPLSVEPRVPFTPPAAPAPEAAPVAPPAPEPPTAALPRIPDAGPREDQPAVTAPPAPEVVAPPVEATRPAEPVQPPTAALPVAPAPAEPPPPPAPVIQAPPVQAVPQVPPAPPAETAASPVPASPPETAARPAPEPEGTLIDGRFLGPNGEPATGGLGQPATPGVRQVAPPPASN
jgi:hypothetical protein